MSRLNDSNSDRSKKKQARKISGKVLKNKRSQELRKGAIEKLRKRLHKSPVNSNIRKNLVDAGEVMMHKNTNISRKSFKDSDEESEVPARLKKVTRSSEHRSDINVELKKKKMKPDKIVLGEICKGSGDVSQETEEIVDQMVKKLRTREKEKQETKGYPGNSELEVQKMTKKGVVATKSGKICSHEDKEPLTSKKISPTKSGGSPQRAISEMCKTSGKQATKQLSLPVRRVETRLGKIQEFEKVKEQNLLQKLVTRSGEYCRCEDEESEQDAVTLSKPSELDSCGECGTQEEAKLILQPNAVSESEDYNYREESCTKQPIDSKVRQVCRNEDLEPEMSRKQMISNESNDLHNVGKELENSGTEEKLVTSGETHEREVEPLKNSPAMKGMSSTSECSLETGKSEELPYPRTPIDFQNREFQEIFGITDEGGLHFCIKFKRENVLYLIPAKVANVQFPQAVIAFYEKNLFWREKEEEVNNS